MKLSLGVSGLAIGLTLAGCNDAPPSHSSDWYRANPEVAQARVKYCDTLALSSRDADCLNAQDGSLSAELHGAPSIKNPYQS